MTPSVLIERWQRICQQIEDAKTVASIKNQEEKSSQAVCLLAVSKTKPADMVVTLLQAGQTHFGENYLQEAIDKIAAVKQWQQNNQDTINHIVWHYIGHIQRNKTRDIAENFDWVHTIERDIIAKRLNNQRPEGFAKLNVLIQVNIDNEDSKSGCHPDELDTLVAAIKDYDRLSLRGLMIIPSKADTNAFTRTKTLFDKIAATHPDLKEWDTLSMGMSADLEAAIQQGSTMVRVGSAIFGERA